MQVFASLIVIAVLIQGVVDAVKGALHKWDWMAMTLGAVLCPLAGIDAFRMAGVPLAIPYVGAALTGVVAGRGAAFVFDILGKIKGEKSPGTDM